MAKKTTKTKGKSNGKGIKGYLIGGDITDKTTIVDPSYKKYKTDVLSTAKDVGLGVVDAGLSGFGGENIIKSKDYSTKTGAQFNEANTVVQAGARQVGGAVVNYFVPGLGTAAVGAMGAVNKGVGKDEGISDKSYKTVDTINQVGGAAGGITSMLNKPKTAETASTVENVPTSTTMDANQFQSQNTTPNPFAGETELNLDPNQQEDLMYGKGFKKGGGIRGKYAAGGKIVGKGTGTSDSINANLEDGGFIAIAKKKADAEALRVKYLGEPKGKVASLKAGNTPVKVSDGEVYFTEDEKRAIIAKGGEEELKALAPEAESSSKELKKGGGIRGKYVTGGGIFDNNTPRITKKENDKRQAGIDQEEYLNSFTPAQNELEQAVKDAKYQATVTGLDTGTSPPVTTNTDKPEIKQPPKKNWFDPVQGIGLGQLGSGLAQSQALGKRPVDTVNPETVSSLAKAKQDATFGLSPEEEAKVNRDIELSRRADVRSITNFAGGDAGVALGNIRGVGISANDAYTKRSIASANLMREKQRYADLRGDALAGASKQLFNEKLEGFNTDQKAVAALTGAGLQNLVQGGRDNRRYANELEARNLRKQGYASANPSDNTPWTKAQIQALAGPGATQAELEKIASERLKVNYNDLTA